MNDRKSILDTDNGSTYTYIYIDSSLCEPWASVLGSHLSLMVFSMSSVFVLQCPPDLLVFVDRQSLRHSTSTFDEGL